MANAAKGECEDAGVCLYHYDLAQFEQVVTSFRLTFFVKQVERFVVD